MSDSSALDVTYVASLARLDLTAEEAARFQEQLGTVLTFVETLSKLDVEGVEPTAHPAPVLDCLRDDVAGECLPREAILHNAPDSALDQIRVPKVVEDA
ncbi:MAG: Asp-tRNA(Asn)/Glu-tRNA(Gln) amidotransferase subunit GatC [Akkermansiaceae bacterium]|nr:Asp-tRNA(Asn)/Glu-tRNA(Gln) amidotransferase subunit GatC [Akkermansiaceae bacterium]